MRIRLDDEFSNQLRNRDLVTNGQNVDEEVSLYGPLTVWFLDVYNAIVVNGIHNPSYLSSNLHKLLPIQARFLSRERISAQIGKVFTS